MCDAHINTFLFLFYFLIGFVVTHISAHQPMHIRWVEGNTFLLPVYFVVNLKLSSQLRQKKRKQ
jgi:hypothetical protein